MKKNISVKMCIIGAGKVGTTMGYFFSRGENRGVELKAISSKTDKSLRRAADLLGDKSKGIVFTKDNLEAYKLANCVLLCTPDDVIEETCSDIVGGMGKEDLRDYYFIHFSGSKSLGVLREAERRGAETASIHPIKSFASIEGAIKTMKDTYYGVTCSSRKSRHFTERLLRVLGGREIKVSDDKKPLYHAALCVSSNYIVTLLNYAVEIHKKIGIKPDESIGGIIGLVLGTVENIKEMGTKKSLTGPIARGDTGTVEEHVRRLKKIFNEDEIRLYRIMGLETGKIAYKNKWINYEEFEKIKEILEC